MASERTLHFSDSFAISCGTVSIDKEASKLLLIRYRKTGEFFFPKGRKDLGETLQHTALRETFEETGFRVELLPLAIPTHATSPTLAKPSKAQSSDRAGGVTEPIAMTQRVASGVLKIIFWFAATGNSAHVRVEGTQQEGEEFDPLWVSFRDVISALSFDEERQIATKVLSAAQNP